MVPPTPKQLQGQGIHSLTDPKTWDVEVKDEAGQVLARVSGTEAREAFAGTDLEASLPHFEPLKDSSPPILATHKNLKLDGSSIPKAPLTNEERLYILKEYSGII